MHSIRKNLALSGLILLLGACSVGPDYERPDVSVPSAYKELPKDWKEASPRDDAKRGDWWKIFNDPLLNALEAQIDISNQNLKAAEAAYRAAIAQTAADSASFFPAFSLEGGGTRTYSKAAPKSNATKYTASVAGSWSLDLWGRIRRTVESDEATAEASAADLASARLSAQTLLAANYFNLRAQDEIKKLLEKTVDGLQRAYAIVRDRYAHGVASKADLMSAQQQLDSAKGQALGAGIERARLEHVIATLIGKTPAELSLAPAPLTTHVATIPVGIPSTLLERRPDIAAAERRVAAANADIGVATAAWFPDLTLTGSYGYSSAVFDKLFQAPSSLWSYGPSLAATLFDAGARSARIDIAEAEYDKTVAEYRQTVLTAFQEVEDNLAALRILAERADAEASVVKAAREAERLTMNQYKTGIVPYSSVITAQNAVLSCAQTALTVRQNRLTASVSLIEALGGGWNNYKEGD